MFGSNSGTEVSKTFVFPLLVWWDQIFAFSKSVVNLPLTLTEPVLCFQYFMSGSFQHLFLLCWFSFGSLFYFWFCLTSNTQTICYFFLVIFFFFFPLTSILWFLYMLLIFATLFHVSISSFFFVVVVCFSSPLKLLFSSAYSAIFRLSQLTFPSVQYPSTFTFLSFPKHGSSFYATNVQQILKYCHLRQLSTKQNITRVEESLTLIDNKS